MSRWSADSRAYRSQRRLFLAANPICWLCGHPAADTIDHAIPVGPPYHGSRYDQANWRPAHGVNSCQMCGQRCNQQRGTRLDPPRRPRSRAW